MKIETIGHNSVRRGKQCSICKLIVKPFEKGLWAGTGAGTGAWHYACVRALVMKEENWVEVDDSWPAEPKPKVSPLDLAFDNYKADIIRKLDDHG